MDEWLPEDDDDEDDFQPKETEILVVVKRPGQQAYPIRIANTLEDMQKIIGGYITYVHLEGDLDLICDEEGMLKHRPVNIAVGDQLIVGTIIVARYEGEEFISMTPEQAVKIRRRLNTSM